MSNGNDFNIDDFLKNFDAAVEKEVKSGGNPKANNSQSNQKSKGFNVNIDRSKDFVDDEEGYMPAYNGEIYFANHKPLNQHEQEETKPAAPKPVKPAPKKKSTGIPIKIASKAAIEKNIQNAEKKAASFANKAKGKKFTKKIGMRAVSTITICLVVSIVLSIIAISCVNDVLAINRNSDEVVTITIPADTSTRKVIHLLDKNGLIKNSLFCNIIAKVQGFRSDNYLPGIYYVTASMGLEGMLLHFKQNQTTGETVRLTFPEGYTADQIIQKLEKYEVCSADIIYRTMKEVDFSAEYDFIKALDDKDERYRYLEGYLYPDTYDFYVGENAASVIRKFLNNFQEKWSEKYQARAAELGMSMDEVVALASIIQKEAFGAEQMPLVSSVIHNRLNNDALFPTLQCDCTTYYITEYVEKNTKDKTLVAALTDKYSTKRCIGLPIGAICNPGNDAINSALYPTETKYYFFLHDNNKKLYLAANDAEQQQNKYAAMKANSGD